MSTKKKLHVSSRLNRVDIAKRTIPEIQIAAINVRNSFTPAYCQIGLYMRKQRKVIIRTIVTTEAIPIIADKV